MYNHAEIISCMRGLVGFDMVYNADFGQIDSQLLSSSSGIYIGSGTHPLLAVDNIYACAENFNLVNVRAWVAGTYKYGDVVSKTNKQYVSLVDSNSTIPGAVGADWQVTNLYSVFLRRLYDNSVTKLVGRLFNEKKVNEVAKSLLANINLFEGVGNISGRIQKQNRLVGLKLTLKNPDTSAALNYIGLQIDTIQNPVTIYLFHSSQSAAIKTFTLNQTKSVSFQWHKITTEVLSCLNDDINAGGSYYLAYYENTITGQAIKKDISFAGKQSCGSCSEGVSNSMLYAKWSNFMQIQPFYVPSDNLPAIGTMWDEGYEMHVDDCNWGLNIQMSVQCDVTRLLCQNKNLIADTLKQQIVVDLLTEMAFSMRDNQKRERSASLSAIALDNQENGQPGEVRKLDQQIKTFNFDFSNISPMCLPCNQIKGRVKSVWK